jgi:uncharacterized protein (TIGR02328 family)
MRLWSQQLINKLPSVKDYKGCSNQLGGQHTEIRMILAKIKKHGKVNHSTVNYVNNYSISELYAYGLLIIDEMIKRGFNVSLDIINQYKGDNKALQLYNKAKNGFIIYKEHNNKYLQECIDNLKNKGVYLI